MLSISLTLKYRYCRYNTHTPPTGTLTIIDMTDHANPVIIGKQGYPHSAYTHQGWLTDDQTHLFLDDEADERRGGLPSEHTRTMSWDVRKLREPTLVHEFFSAETVIDHNQCECSNRRLACRDCCRDL